MEKILEGKVALVTGGSFALAMRLLLHLPGEAPKW